MRESLTGALARDLYGSLGALAGDLVVGGSCVCCGMGHAERLHGGRLGWATI